MMKFKIATFLLLSLFFTNHLYSQNIAANIGYSFMGRNAGFLGVDLRLNHEGEMAKNLGIGTYLTAIDKEFTAIPEIHYNQMIGESSGIMWQISASTKNLKPSIGFNFLNAGRIDVGYSFGIDKAKSLQGLTFGVHFLLGGKHFYDRLNLIQ